MPTIKSASAPVYSMPDNGSIDIILDTEEFGVIHFTASPADPEPHSRELFKRAVDGEFGPIGAYVPDDEYLTQSILSISRRQCAAEMFARDLITGSEAVAMSATATPPAIVEVILAALPEPDQTLARMKFTENSYLRSDPLLNAFMSAVPGTTETDIDQFFRNAALQ